MIYRTVASSLLQRRRGKAKHTANPQFIASFPHSDVFFMCGKVGLLGFFSAEDGLCVFVEIRVGEVTLTDDGLGALEIDLIEPGTLIAYLTELFIYWLPFKLTFSRKPMTFVCKIKVRNMDY